MVHQKVQRSAAALALALVLLALLFAWLRGGG